MVTGYHFGLDRPQKPQMHSYLESWFVHADELTAKCGASWPFIQALIEAQACPGIVYSTDGQGRVWSALGAYLGHPIEGFFAGETVDWFSPAAVSWIRLAELSEARSPCEKSEFLQDRFHLEFSLAIEALPDSLRQYADRIDDAEHAWDAWVRGAYAVCLKAFSAELVVEKLTRRLRAHELLALGVHSLSPSEKLTLLEDVTRLSEILTPFSPFERPNGTPGTVIDKALSELGLGCENPFG